MRSLALLLVFVITLLILIYIDREISYQQANTLVNDQQMILNAKVYTVYKLFLDSGYLDAVARLEEFSYNSTTTWQFFQDYVRVVYLNRLLTNTTREFGLKVKVYMNGTLIFDSEESDVNYLYGNRLTINQSNVYQYLKPDEKFYVFPYISPSLQYYKIIIIVGS